jgi:Fe2+ or Zn2+ uptake regulation protein
MIRAAGLRSTSSRVAVLRYLMGAEQPVSHANLVEALADEGFDRATIYRNLMDLTEVALLTRSDLGDHVWRFELRRDGQDTPRCIRTSHVRIAGKSPACPVTTSSSRAPRASRAP